MSDFGASRPAHIDAIIAAVLADLRVSDEDFRGRCRHPRVVLAREVVAYLGRRMTMLSYPELAAAMGRPNHSTVMTAFRRIAARLDDDGEVGAGPTLELVSRIEAAMKDAQ